jgi:hypothetical protein
MPAKPSVADYASTSVRFGIIAAVLIAARLRVLSAFLALVAAGSFGGCHKKTTDATSGPAPDGDAVKRSLAALQTQLGELKARFTGLRKQIETIPPELPGFPEARGKFYATEEARGVMDAKVTLLSNRLDAALSAGKRDDLKQVAKEIGDTFGEVGQINTLYVTSLHQVMALQRMALRDKDATPAPGPPSSMEKPRRPKPKQ